MGRVCVSNLSKRPCNLQGRTAGSQGSLDKSRLCQMSGRSVRQKTLESKESSLKSVPLAVQQHKNTRKRWKLKHLRKVKNENTWERWKMETPERWNMRKFRFLKYKKSFKSGFFSFFELGKYKRNIRVESSISRNIRKFCYARVLNIPFLKYKKGSVMLRFWIFLSWNITKALLC